MLKSLLKLLGLERVSETQHHSGTSSRKEHLERNQDLRNHDSAALLRAATAAKDSGNLEYAVELVRLGLQAGKTEGVEYGIQTSLKLPNYLASAGRRDEAWAAYNSLLIETTAQRGANDEVLPFDHAAIYDKMRLFLQREKRFTEAIEFAVLSYLNEAEALRKQKRWKELEDTKATEGIEYAFQKHLKKAEKLDRLPRIIRILQNSISRERIASIRDVSVAVSKIVTGQSESQD